MIFQETKIKGAFVIEFKPLADYRGFFARTWCQREFEAHGIFFLYGPHEPPGRLIPSVIQALLKGEFARCSHGRQIRDFLYVEDVAEAFVALLDSDITGPVNIASGSPTPRRRWTPPKVCNKAIPPEFFLWPGNMLNLRKN